MFKMFWDVYVLVLLLAVCTVIPWRLAFDGESFGWELTYTIVDSCFFIDIILTFFTTITSPTHNQVEIEDKKEIAINYLTGWFAIDFLSIVPFDMIIKAIS
jgi:hypothetical protein